MKKLLIDMDDVICEGNFLTLANKFLNTNYKKEDLKDFYIQHIIPEEKREEWIKFFRNHNSYDYVVFVPDAYEVIEKLNSIYDIYIVTAYIIKEDKEFAGTYLKYKYDWLYKNMPFIPPEKYIFCSNKHIVDGDIRIDDRIENLTGKSETKLLFTAYHNKKIEKSTLTDNNIIRVNNWKEIKKLLI